MNFETLLIVKRCLPLMQDNLYYEILDNGKKEQCEEFQEKILSELFLISSTK